MRKRHKKKLAKRAHLAEIEFHLRQPETWITPHLAFVRRMEVDVVDAILGYALPLRRATDAKPTAPQSLTKSDAETLTELGIAWHGVEGNPDPPAAAVCQAQPIQRENRS